MSNKLNAKGLYAAHLSIIQAIMYMSASLGGFAQNKSSGFEIRPFLMRKAAHCFPSLDKGN
jgi:hypothetical protein